MSFIKHGDGKILNVVESEDDLTEDQKKVAKNAKKQLVKPLTDETDLEKSGE